MEYIYLILLVISSISTGYDYFFVQVFKKGLEFLPADKKIITNKFVLAASVKYFLPVRILLIVIPLGIIFYILIKQINIKIHWWIVLFVMMFYGLYYIGYLFPKVRRIFHWDLKNPQTKWEELYKSYEVSCKLLLIISFFNFLLVIISLLLEILMVY